MNKRTWMGLAVWLAAAVSALGWGPAGHAVTAGIAEGRLTPRARAEVQAILGDRQLGDYEVASWPDLIRGTAEYEDRYPRNGRWHFVEFDVTQWYDENFELALPGDGQDIVTQIGRWRDALASGKLEGEERLNALRFLVHFTGDIHQPLHCAYRYGDMGGNMIPVNSFRGEHFSFGPEMLQDESWSIHSVWDEAMVQELMAGADVEETVRRLNAGIAEDQARRWSVDDPMAWAVDSYWRARKEAYRWADGTPLPFKWMRPGMDLADETYIDARLPLAKEQLQKAGVRLAHLLNTALDPEYVSPTGVKPE